MLAQSLLGLLFRGQYRDVEWIKATWFGNDWVTLVVALPLLLVGLALDGRGSVRGLLLWLGVVGYAAYNYAYYLLGAALNAFFPLYVASFVLAVVVLILVLSRLDLASIADNFLPTTPVRIIGGYLVAVGVSLASVWIALWAAYVFAGRPTPVEPEAFRLVAALDLSLMGDDLYFRWRSTLAASAMGICHRGARRYSGLALSAGAVGQLDRRDPPGSRGRPWRASYLGFADRPHDRHDAAPPDEQSVSPRVMERVRVGLLAQDRRTDCCVPVSLGARPAVTVRAQRSAVVYASGISDGATLARSARSTASSHAPDS